MDQAHAEITKSIPEDLLIEILSKLPLESLHKFKCVSKSWPSLITQQVLPKIPPPPFIGFFYKITGYYRGNTNNFFSYNNINNSAIDPTLTFLPSSSRVKISILDCCNGLVLCYSCNRSDYREAYYVCNPTTKSWTKLPKVDYQVQLYYTDFVLDFNPRVSPHYKVVSLSQRRQTQFLICTYNSETRRWKEKRIKFRFPINPVNANNHSYALRNRKVYMAVAKSCEAVCFGLLKFVGFPVGTEMPRHATCIGNSGDKLFFAGLDRLQLRVWSLGRKQVWVLEHDSTICGKDVTDLPQILGIHPSLAAIFVLVNSVVFTYDLENMRLTENCQIGTEGQQVYSANVFPFSPCSVDLLENRNRDTNATK